MNRRQGIQKRILFLTGILLIVTGLLLYVGIVPKQHFGTVREDVLLSAPDSEDLEGMLAITQSRVDYRRGDLLLVIPIIDLTAAVGESTESALLAQMPGLYEFSQLPGWGDINVSIAGHRDVYGKEFYSLGKLSEGDYLYLIHDDTVYRYLYTDTTVVPPDSWNVILPQGFSCLTLTTCDPIGTTLNRLIVRAGLVDTEPYQIENMFPATINDGFS